MKRSNQQRHQTRKTKKSAINDDQVLQEYTFQEAAAPEQSSLWSFNETACAQISRQNAQRVVFDFDQQNEITSTTLNSGWPHFELSQRHQNFVKSTRSCQTRSIFLFFTILVATGIGGGVREVVGQQTSISRSRSEQAAAARAEANKLPPNIYKWIEDNGHICSIVSLVGENLVSFLSVDEGVRCNICPDPGPRRMPLAACAVETSPNELDNIAVKCQQLPELCVKEYRDRYAEFFSGEVAEPGPESLLRAGATSLRPFSSSEHLSSEEASSAEDGAGPFFNANRNPFTVGEDTEGNGGAGRRETTTSLTSFSFATRTVPIRGPMKALLSSTFPPTTTSTVGTSRTTSSSTTPTTTTTATTPTTTTTTITTSPSTTTTPASITTTTTVSLQLILTETSETSPVRIISANHHRSSESHSNSLDREEEVEPSGRVGGVGLSSSSQSVELVDNVSSALQDGDASSSSDDDANSVETLASPSAPLPPPPLPSQKLVEPAASNKLLTVNTECTDTHELCCFWAISGECEHNPFWMRVHCAKTCGTCNCSLNEADRCISSGIVCHTSTTTTTTTTTSTTPTSTTTTASTTTTPATSTLKTTLKPPKTRGKGRTRPPHFGGLPPGHRPHKPSKHGGGKRKGGRRPPSSPQQPPQIRESSSSTMVGDHSGASTSATAGSYAGDEGGELELGTGEEARAFSLAALRPPFSPTSPATPTTWPPAPSNPSPPASSPNYTASAFGISFQRPQSGGPASAKHPKGCQNTHHLCKFWADLGECKSNPFWMRPNCQLECNSCGETLLDVLPAKSRIGCENFHRFCPFWAFVGECAKNPRWMTHNCRGSCQLY